MVIVDTTAGGGVTGTGTNSGADGAAAADDECARALRLLGADRPAPRPDPLGLGVDGAPLTGAVGAGVLARGHVDAATQSKYTKDFTDVFLGREI